MNVKTTLALAFFLIVSVSALVVLRSRPAESADAAPPLPGTPVISRDLIEDKLGDVIRIAVNRKNHDDEWVFERVETDQGMTGEWRMTAPLDTKAIRWEVAKIPRQLATLRYEISYGPSEAGGVSAADAGLEPPGATITLTDRDGKTAAIQIGNAASADTTYVRLAGSDRVCVGKSNLRNLLKSKAIEYRNNQPWTFKPSEVTRLEVVEQTDGVPRTYTFVPVGSGWHMESPAVAKATDKVADAVLALSRLRAASWVDDDADRLAVYGLSPASLAIHVTVEQTIEVESAADDSETTDDEPTDDSDSAKVLTRTTVHELYLSDRSPIGDETNAYFRVGDPPVVGTIAKTIADKLRPVMDEWRDMHVTTADVATATGIDLDIEGQRLRLVRRDGAWFIDPGDEHAEDAVVSAMLSALGDMKATAFVDHGSGGTLITGLDKPRATISLTLPGVDAPLRVRVGGPTDQATKLLGFVQFADDGPIAKVRTSDIDGLLKPPLAYRDRTIFNLVAAQIQRLAFSINAPFADQRLIFAVARSEDKWSMVEPAQAPVQADAVEKLVDAIARLRAEHVVGTSGQETGYGLDDPSVRLTIETVDESTYVLLATEHDAGYYARREDTDSIYEISGALFAQLRAELREPAVLLFDAADVVSFSVRHGETEHGFERSDDRWVYRAETDLPLDAKKVEDLLLRIRDLKTERFVRYDDGADAVATGLSDPERTITVVVKNGTRHVLLVSSRGGVVGAPPGRLASVAGQPGVFVLSNEMLSRAVVSIEALASR